MPLIDRWYMHPNNCDCVECKRHKIAPSPKPKPIPPIKRTKLTKKEREHLGKLKQTPTETINKSPSPLDNYLQKYPISNKPFSMLGCIVLLVLFMLAVGVLVGGIYVVSKNYKAAGDWTSQEYQAIEGNVTTFTDNIPDLITTSKEMVINSEILKTITGMIDEFQIPEYVPPITPPTPTPIINPTPIPEPVPTIIIPTISKPQLYLEQQNLISTEDFAIRFNAYRQSQGLRPLIFTDDLNARASLRIPELKEDYSHSSIGNYNQRLAENINWISSGYLSNSRALNSWQNSLGHNANMLDPSYKYTGYANKGGYAIQLFTQYPTINGVPQLPPGWYWKD